MDAMLTHTTTAIGRRQLRTAGIRSSAGATLRRLQATIVNGSDHPCWRQVDAATSLVLLPAREQDRLLREGRVPTYR